MRLPAALDALQDRRFAWYFGARTVSMMGSSMAPVALTFAVLHLENTASALSQVLAARMIPLIVLLLVGGVISDRFSRSTVLQLSHGLTALTQGAAAVLIITGQARLWMIIVLEALNGAVSAFTMPAMMGIVPQVVSRSNLLRANALLSFSRSGMMIIGPSVAALLVVTVGAGWALAADALTYLVAILFLMRLRLPVREPAHPEVRSSLVRDLREGWTEFSSRTWLWLIVVAFGFTNAIHSGAWGVLGPLVAKATPAIGERGWGLIVSAEAVGVLVMTLLMLRLSIRYPLRAGMIASGCFAAPMLLLGARPALVPVMVATFAAGLGAEVFGVGWNTALHENIPEAVLSRVSSYDMLGSFVAGPFGVLLYGVLAASFAPRSLLVVSFVVYATICLATLLSRSVRNLERLAAPDDPDDPDARCEPSTAGVAPSPG